MITGNPIKPSFYKSPWARLSEPTRATLSIAIVAGLLLIGPFALFAQPPTTFRGWLVLVFAMWMVPMLATTLLRKWRP